MYESKRKERREEKKGNRVRESIDWYADVRKYEWQEKKKKKYVTRIKTKKEDYLGKETRPS